jgi:hypothetical protein
LMIEYQPIALVVLQPDNLAHRRGDSITPGR